jgi:hypothetical protein
LQSLRSLLGSHLYGLRRFSGMDRGFSGH